MEKFIPFEIAKKLEEKGFEIKQGTNYLYYNGKLVRMNDYCNISPYEYAPTIDEVLKWLREEKEMHICIDIYDNGWFFDVRHIYEYHEDTGVYEIKLPYMSSNVTPDYESYELAALAAIEFCLTYLI